MMEKKICLVTGATSGIGEVTARELARQGAHVVLLARNEAKAAQVQEEIKRISGNDKVDVLLADLSSLKQVRQVAATFNSRYPRLDVLVNNAGLLMGSERQVSEDGYEQTLAVNHLAPFLLTSLLFPKLLQSREPRIVNVASEAYRAAKPDFNDFNMEHSYSAIRAYSNSKLYNILFTRELARRAQEQGHTHLVTNAVHPGMVASNFSVSAGGWMHFIFKLMSPFAISSEKGAETGIYLASHPAADKYNGQYFAKKKPKPVKHAFATPENAARLWEISEKLVEEKFL